MSIQSRKYDIYLPLTYNDGRSIEEEKYRFVHNVLFERFGGVTSMMHQFPLRGVWGDANQIYQDYIVIYTTIDFAPSDETEQFFTDYKERLREEFQQEEILITGHDLTVY
jgi:hypothetical protein